MSDEVQTPPTTLVQLAMKAYAEPSREAAAILCDAMREHEYWHRAIPPMLMGIELDPIEPPLTSMRARQNWNQKLESGHRSAAIAVALARPDANESWSRRWISACLAAMLFGDYPQSKRLAHYTRSPFAMARRLNARLVKERRAAAVMNGPRGIVNLASVTLIPGAYVDIRIENIAPRSPELDVVLGYTERE